MKKSPKNFVGTSGWQYGHWAKKFYPKDLPRAVWLKFYAQLFNTVEINSTFYRMPTPKLFESWRKQVADRENFLFAVKLNMHFTRFKRLKLDRETSAFLKDFLFDAALLQKHLGPILIQLPPSMKIDLETLEKFAAALKKYSTAAKKKFPEIDFLFAIEFRHKSWFVQECYKLLKKYNIAFVIADGERWPAEAVKTADWVYLRFHGKPVLYVSDYSDEELVRWQEIVRKMKPKKVFAYFNNDAAGHAPENARTFSKLLNTGKV